MELCLNLISDSRVDACSYMLQHVAGKLRQTLLFVHSFNIFCSLFRAASGTQLLLPITVFTLWRKSTCVLVLAPADREPPFTYLQRVWMGLAKKMETVLGVKLFFLAPYLHPIISLTKNVLRHWFRKATSKVKDLNHLTNCIPFQRKGNLRIHRWNPLAQGLGGVLVTTQHSWVENNL